MTAPRYESPSPDPQAKLRELQQDTQVSPEIAELRLAVLRREVPGVLVQIDAVRADDTAIAVKATIGLPGGARHSAIAAVDVEEDSSWAAQMEMVQATAIARALDGLRSRPSRTPEDSPQPAETPTRVSTSQPQQQDQQVTEPSAETDHLPEYSWNAFWQTMNTRNITRDQVQQALGKSVQEVTPKEAVDALKAAGLLDQA